MDYNQNLVSVERVALVLELALVELVVRALELAVLVDRVELVLERA